MADEAVQPTSAEEEAPAAEAENQTPPSQATDTPREPVNRQLTLGEQFPSIPAETWVDDLGLRNATRNVLKSNGLNRFGSSEESGLWSMTEDDLLGIRRFGRAKLADLLVSLEAYERKHAQSPEGKTPARRGQRSKAAGHLHQCRLETRKVHLLPP